MRPSKEEGSYALVLDIETVPNSRADAWVQKQRISPDPKLNGVDEPPSSIANLKTPELRDQRIAEWKAQQAIKIEQDVAQKRQKLYQSGGLRWWTGQVVCIGTWDQAEDRTAFYSGVDEADVLTRFFSDLAGKYALHVLVGKQSSDFDIPFLVGRAIALNLGVPDRLRPYYPISDVNDIFSRSHSCQQRGKLEDYAWGMGIDGKDGSWEDVLPAYQAAVLGDANALKRIETYCQRDVEITREMWLRFQKAFPAAAVEKRPSQTGDVVDGIKIPF